MKLYTKTGDDGSTSLFGGQRIAKSSLRVEAYGDIDETNSAIGSAIAECAGRPSAEVLLTVQRELFCIGAVLAAPGADPGIQKIGPEQIEQLECWIDRFHGPLPPMKSFVLPGGCRAAGALDHARAVCRRAERALARLAELERIDKRCLVYLNRLSDLLFALARHANHEAKVDDVAWCAPRSRS